MRRGFVTFEPIECVTAIEFATEHGFDFVELQMAYAAAGRPQLGREFLADREAEIRPVARSAGVDLLVHLPHTMDVGATSEIVREAAVEETEACLRTAASLGAQKCVLHPTSSARTRVWDADVIRGRILESVRELDGFARERGITLCVENIPHSTLPSHEFDRFFEETDCAMTLDTGHARVSGMGAEAIADFADAHRTRIGHVHANDNKSFLVATGGAPGDDHVPTGSGDLDFGTALSPLLDGWEGTVSLEMHTAALEYVAVAGRQFDRMLEEAGGG